MLNWQLSRHDKIWSRSEVSNLLKQLGSPPSMIQPSKLPYGQSRPETIHFTLLHRLSIIWGKIISCKTTSAQVRQFRITRHNFVKSLIILKHWWTGQKKNRRTDYLWASMNSRYSLFIFTPAISLFSKKSKSGGEQLATLNHTYRKIQ